MRSRWGSCSVSGQICLNLLLVRPKLPLIDFVIAHELCHLRYFSLNKDFFVCSVRSCQTGVIVKNSFAIKKRSSTEVLKPCQISSSSLGCASAVGCMPSRWISVLSVRCPLIKKGTKGNEYLSARVWKRRSKDWV